MEHVEAVAGPGVIHVIARRVRNQAVIRLIIDAAEGQGGAELVAFGSVVVYDIENDLQACRVEGLDHGLELGNRIRDGVTRLRSKEANGVVAPVVAKPSLYQVAVINEIVHWHQLDSGHSQSLQVVDHRGGGEAGVGSAQVGSHLRMPHGEPADVNLVNNAFMPGSSGRSVFTPGEGGIHHATLGHAQRAIAAVEGEVSTGVTDAISKMGVAPVKCAVNLLGIRIEQQLVMVEAQATIRLIGPVDAIAV